MRELEINTPEERNIDVCETGSSNGWQPDDDPKFGAF